MHMLASGIKRLYRNKIVKNLSAVLFSLIIGYSILEFILRILYPIKFESLVIHSTKKFRGDTGFSGNIYFRPSESLGYEPIPGAMYKKPHFKVNSLGMFDKERSKDKTNGTYRILFIGDSTTARSEYVDMLEKMLNQNEVGRVFEAWNCGVPSYGALQYFTSIRQKWLAYTPDMIIISFCLNDFDTTPLLVKENNNLIGYFPFKEILPQVNPFMFRHSFLYRFMVVRILAPQDKKSYLYREVETQLSEMHGLLSQRNIRFLVVILGLVDRLDKYPHWKDRYNKIKEILSAHHIENIDLVPVFEANDPKSLQQNAADELHFNAKGSLLVARAIYDYLVQD